jgi:site-specific DNA recombinase
MASTPAGLGGEPTLGKVILKPGPERGQIEAVLHGELGALLDLVAQNAESRTPGKGVRLSLVAGVGFEPTTFRL